MSRDRKAAGWRFLPAKSRSFAVASRGAHDMGPHHFAFDVLLLSIPLRLRRGVFPIHSSFGEKGNRSDDGEEEEKDDENSYGDGIAVLEIFKPSRNGIPATHGRRPDYRLGN